MVNKNEQKKEYTTPEMRTIELRQGVNLLQGSTNCPLGCYCDEAN